LTAIWECAFKDCSSITAVTIPVSVKSIREEAFDNCSNLKDLYLKSTTPPTLYGQISPTKTKLHVPAGCKEIYSQSQYWNLFEDIVED
jgi:hypothetical protein